MRSALVLVESDLDALGEVLGDRFSKLLFNGLSWRFGVDGLGEEVQDDAGRDDHFNHGTSVNAEIRTKELCARSSWVSREQIWPDVSPGR